MADSANRKEKVEAGLKKLKQFQQRSGRKQPKIKPPAPVESLANRNSTPDLTKSTNSSIETSTSFMQTKSGSLNEISTANSNHSLDTVIEPEIPSTIERLTETSTTINSNFSSSKENLSSRESLLQITQRINGLMSQTHDLLNGDLETVPPPGEANNTSHNNMSTLEWRNQALAAQLNGQQQTNQQLQFQLNELKSRLSRAQKDIEREKEELRERGHKEQVALKDQLQVHIQTIGILVAEKTELQSTLTQSQQTAKQKAADNEELQGRLRASRQRAADLERGVSSLSASSQQYEKSSKEFSKEVDRLKMDVYKIGKQLEESNLQKVEFGEKLKSKITECQETQSEMIELRTKISMQDLYIQQLTNTASVDSNGAAPSAMQQLEDLHQDKLDLERKVKENKETFQRMAKEKEQLSEQYQTFVKQLNDQLDSLKSESKLVKEQLEAASKENLTLKSRMDTIQQSHSNKPDIDEQNDGSEKLKSLQDENETLRRQLETQTNDNAQFSVLVDEKEAQILGLEQNLSRIRDQSVDHEQLLERMQSDKVAASRAVTQNRELKKQLEELQDVFVKLNNDKLELTENYQREQHVTKELGERLCQQEDELQDLRDQLTARDRRMHELEENTTRNQFKEHQIVDRMRHYEAQGQLSEMLQQELSQAQDRINALTDQNSQLRMALARQAEVSVATGELKNGDDTNDQTKRNDLVASLSSSVRQLELERDQLLRQLETQQDTRETLKAQMREAAANRKNQIPGSEDSTISKEDYEDLKNSMNQLEERFRKTMDQIAELSDQKQQLEHLVTQLQGETDTIADYITLYQVQRGVMKQRAEEKDEYISQLARDREDLKTKLGELQDLVIHLMEEKKFLQAYGNSGLPENAKPPGWAVPLHNGNEKEDSTADSNGFSEICKNNHQSNLENTKPKKGGENTAKKIMDLLNDIGTSNLVEKPLVDTFHPCPVCSGRLMTV